jgi:peptidoglycan/xylan/chitin deacetylase (PgdA/CDA1 family)
VDPWEGDYEQPVSLHRFGYSINNPLRFRDPSGYIYLTFDDGPELGVDDSILDTLRSFNAEATFFFQGNKIDLNDHAIVEIVWMEC